jgi:vacuolar-type H+-ATPase subunit E/Vma4
VESEAQKITDQILIDAREDAKSVIIETRKSAEMMLERQVELGRQKAAERVSSIVGKARNESDITREMVFTDIRRKAGWMVLSEKERLITNVLDEAKSRLTALAKTEKYIPELERIILDAGIALGGGELQIILNDRYSDLSLKLNAISKAVSEKTGNRTELKLSKEGTKTSGGVIVKLVDGKVILDNTFEAILKRRERGLRLKIARILFK